MGRLQARPALHHYVRALGHSGIVIPDFSDIYGVNLVNDWDAVNKVLNGGDVSRVTDAQANDDIDQSNASRQPLWEAAGGPGPNGAPSIAHTVANSDALANTAYTSLGADVPYTVYLVFKHTAWAAFQQYLMLEDSAGGDTLRFRARTGADRYEITFNNAVSTSTIEGANDVGNWHVARLTYNDAGQLAGLRHSRLGGSQGRVRNRCRASSPPSCVNRSAGLGVKPSADAHGGTSGSAWLCGRNTTADDKPSARTS